MKMRALPIAATATEKIIVTTSPEVVRLSSRFMHVTFSSLAELKHMRPSLQLVEGVVVAMQVVAVGFAAPEVAL